MPATAHALTLADVIVETEDARSFVFDVPPELADAFAYQPGQFLTVELPWEGGFSIRRCYSLSSAPEVDARPKVTVKRVAGGRASNWMIDHLRPGDVVQVQPPEGRFVLDSAAPASRPIVLLGGGSGITPMMSLLRSALASTGRHILLVYANRDANSVIFKDALAELAAQHPDRFTLRHHLDSDGGYLTVAQLSEQLAGWEAGDVYVCGPAPFMDLVEIALPAAGFDLGRAKFERFVSPVDPDRREAAAALEPTTGEVVTAFELRLDGKAHTVSLGPGQTLLAAAKGAGIDAPHSCEDGFCGACMAKLVSGDVVMETHEALSSADIARKQVLLCQSRAVSAKPLVVDYDQASFAPVSGDGAAAASDPRGSRVGVVIAIAVAVAVAVRLFAGG